MRIAKAFLTKDTKDTQRAQRKLVCVTKIIESDD